MKILIAGQFKKWALENHFARYLRPHCEVFEYAAEDVFDDFYRHSTLNKIRFKLGLTKIYDKIAEELLAKADEVKPDIIWVFKGMRILPKALLALKKRGILLANYNPDHPFLFSSAGSGNRNVTDGIGLFDLHLCYSRSVQRRIEAEFGIRTAFLPFGYELPEATFEAAKDEREILSACFIGNPDEIRAAHLRFLADNGVPVDVFGHGWEAFFPKENSGVRLHKAAYGEDFWRKMRAYRLQINVFRPHNEGSHNMRTFEIPAVGGFMLAPDSPEHRVFFEPEKEVFLYASKEEMLAQARRILDLSEAAAADVRLSARGRSVASGYSYEERARQAYEAFQQLLSGQPGSSLALKSAFGTPNLTSA